MTIQLNYCSRGLLRWRESGFTDFGGLSEVDRRQIWNALMRGHIRENGEPIEQTSEMYIRIVQETEQV